MAADFPQQHWHQTSSVFVFMALFTIRAHLTGYWAPPDKEHTLISVIVPANRLWLHPDCILLWAWFVLTAEQVCRALLLLLHIKMTLGVCDHFETKLLQCIMKQKENIHIVIGWWWQQHHRCLVFLTLSYSDVPLDDSVLLLSLSTSLWKLIPEGTKQQLVFGKTTRRWH